MTHRRTPNNPWLYGWCLEAVSKPPRIADWGLRIADWMTSKSAIENPKSAIPSVLRWALVSLLMPICWAAPESKEAEPQRFPVVVRVDFGAAGKPAREAQLFVDSGSTPKDVVSLLFPIESDAICCNTREVAAIDGIRADPEKNRWWTCRINGASNIGPFRTELKPQDWVEWIYREQQQ